MPRYIPREHGGWSMLAVSFVVGAAHGTHWNWGILNLAFLLFAGYSLRAPLLGWMQRKRRDAIPWLVGYLLIIVCAAVPLVWHSQRRILFAALVASGLLFVINFWVTTRRLQRSVPAEFLGVIGLTFVSVLAYTAAEGTDLRRAALIWFLSVLYFGSSVFYVKLRLEQHIAERRAERPERLSYQRRSLVYYLVLVLCLALLVMTHMISAWGCIAFLPLLARWWIQSRQLSLSIRQLGFTELGMSIVYAVGMILLLF